MDKSPENPDQLIKEIINFVKAERELYGDFTVPNIKAGNKTTDTVKPDSVDHNASSPKQTQPPTTFSPESKWFQEINNKQSYRSEEHTSELQSRFDLVCRLLLEKKNNIKH